MRLWHQSLIKILDRQRLLAQHRECCALRGAGWGKKHATVDYVFTHEPEYLIAYHTHVTDEMLNRRYNVDNNWLDPEYRGKNGLFWTHPLNGTRLWYLRFEKPIVYPEHNEKYYQECRLLLKSKFPEHYEWL